MALQPLSKILTSLILIPTVALTAIVVPKAVTQPTSYGSSTLTALPTSQSWQNPQLIRTITGNSHPVGALAITPDGNNIVSGTDDGTIKVWDLKTGKLLRTLTGHTDTILSLAISPDGQTLASASGINEKSVKIWNLKTGALMRTIQQPDWFVKSLAISPDGKSLALGIWNTTANNPQVKVLNLSTGESLHSFQGSKYSNLTVSYSPDGQTLAIGYEDSTIQLWDLHTGNLLHTLNQGAAVKALAFSQDSKTLMSESYTQTFKVWNVATGKLISSPIANSGIVFVNAVAFNPNGKMFASALGGEKGALKLFDLPTGNVISPFTGFSGIVYSLAFTPNGSTLVTGNFDGTISIWQGRFLGSSLRAITSSLQEQVGL